MKKYLFLVILVVVSQFLFPSFAYSQFFPYLRVNDPQQFSRYMGEGVMKDVEVEVTPLGLTTQFDFTFKMSNFNESNLNQSTQYELVYHFWLPDNAFIRDSWLWVDDTLVVAEIKDIWSANSIYEGIVKRRKDPSILQKVQSTYNEYELKVYPYLKGKPRKVRISYCVYNEYKNGMFDTKFPILNMLNTRNGEGFKDYNLKINLNDKIEFQYLSYFNLGNINPEIFTKIDNTLNLSTSINFDGNNAYANFKFKPKMENGFFININEHKVTKDKYYELLLDVGSLQSQFIANKYIFVIDFNQDKTNVNYQSLVDVISSFIRNNLSANDKFNIINSSTRELSFLSETWLDFNQDNFDKADLWMKTISPRYDFNIEMALDSAAQFFVNTQSNGTVFTFSSSDHLGASSNQSINSISSKFNQTKSTFNCISFANTNYATYNIGGKQYYANEYFFNNIASLTRGNYANSSSVNDIAIQTANLMNKMVGSIEEGELTLSSQNALAFQKRDLKNLVSGNNASPIFAETGKLFGELPVEFKFTGIYRNNIVTASSKVVENIDSSGRFAPIYQIWKSREISRLEAMNNNTKEHNWSIVDHSLESRVLSKFTAFLALEPWMMNYANPYEKEEDENTGTSIGEIELNEAINIEIYPNPVESKSVINITTNLEFVTEQMEVELLDYTGKIVKKIGLQDINREFTFEPIDDDGNKISSGKYVLIFKSKYGTISKNLIIK